MNALPSVKSHSQASRVEVLPSLRLTVYLPCCRVAAVIGSPLEHIVVSATHSHSGPCTVGAEGNPPDSSFCARLVDGIVSAAKAAKASAVESSIEWYRGACPDTSFNHRFVMADGTVETSPLALNPLIVKPEGPDVSTLHAMQCTDGAGTRLGAAVFFGCTPNSIPGNSAKISTDFPGKVSSILWPSVNPSTML